MIMFLRATGIQQFPLTSEIGSEGWGSVPDQVLLGMIFTQNTALCENETAGSHSCNDTWG